MGKSTFSDCSQQNKGYGKILLTSMKDFSTLLPTFYKTLIIMVYPDLFYDLFFAQTG